MTQDLVEFEEEFASDRPPGVDHLFGTTARNTSEGTESRTVLTRDEDVHLRPRPYRWLEGDFAFERFGRGHLCIAPTATPGELHIEADVRRAGGPDVHIDARVRESWLARAASIDDSIPASVHVVQGLIRLAEIPRQSTVKVLFRGE